MKKKGFTLIELLAVIVILAIIALIAIPQITKVVDEAKKGAAESSALGYIDAVEKYIMLHDVDSTKYPYDLRGKTLNVAKNTDISLLDIFVKRVYAESEIPALNSFITVKGDKPKSGYVTINNKGKVQSAEFGINGYRVICQNGKCNANGTYEEITITYSLNGGTLDKSNDKIYKGTSLTLPIPTKNGYRFDGWYTEANGGTEVTDETIFNNSQIIYAHWINIKLSSIAVKTNPTKMTYTSGDLLDLTGLEILATYENGDEKTLEYNSIVSSPTNNSRLTGMGQKTITISYTDGIITKSTSITINVNPIRFAQDSSNTLEYNGYDGNLSTSAPMLRNSYKYIRLPSNSAGNKISISFMNANSIRFGVIFYDSNMQILTPKYIFTTLSSNDKSDFQCLETNMTHDSILTRQLTVPSGASYLGLAKIDCSNTVSVYDVYMIAA